MVSLVKFIHGASDGAFALPAGTPISSVRASLIDAFNIPELAVPFVNGKRVHDHHRLMESEVVEFSVPWGQKGSGDNPKNYPCGECKACCVVLPIAEPDFVKPAGEPCKHLCEAGCKLFGSPELPRLCKEYFCGWRLDKWLNQRPLYRPDKLGVIFQFHPDVLVLYEVRPGSLGSPQVEYIKARLKKMMRSDVIVKNYPVGVLDGIRVDPATVKNGAMDLDTKLHEWQDHGGGELTLRFKPGVAVGEIEVS